MKQDIYLREVVFVQEQTVSKYVDVNTIGYGAELADADPDAVAEAEPVADAEERVDDADEHAVEKLISWGQRKRSRE